MTEARDGAPEPWPPLSGPGNEREAQPPTSPGESQPPLSSFGNKHEDQAPRSVSDDGLRSEAARDTERSEVNSRSDRRTAPSEASGPDKVATAATSKDKYRQQMIDSIGGWQGALITAVPTTVFVIVNVFTELRPAVIAAVATAIGLALYRLVRKQSTQQALSGLFGVVIAALIAARTGEARGYFLLGIWTSFLYAVPFALSLLFRRPLIGLAWEFLDPSPTASERPWYRQRPLLLAYTYATLAAVVVFLARGFVQLHLYGDNATGWLAFARIAMGYPLFIAAAGFSFVVVKRARRQLAASA